MGHELRGPTPEYDMAWWHIRESEAQRFMDERAAKFTRVLIEVAAQHPLMDGRYPGEEFADRLTQGLELFKQHRAQGKEVEFYVPGSVHMHKGVTDHVSLARAGTQYLIGYGVPSDVVHGEDLNEKYKGEDGVYNSADECYVAARYFKDNDFGRFDVIESPYQISRKGLHYIAFGVRPNPYCNPSSHLYHSLVKEIFEDIPRMAYDDPTCQEMKPGSYAWITRRERMPGFVEAHKEL